VSLTPIDPKGEVMRIGSYNLIETGARTFSTRVSHASALTHRLCSCSFCSPPPPGVSSRRVGDRNTIEIRGWSLFSSPSVSLLAARPLSPSTGSSVLVAAVLSEGTVVGNDCVVGVNVRIPPNEVLPDSVVVFGPLNTHRTLTDTKEVIESTMTFLYVFAPT